MAPALPQIADVRGGAGALGQLAPQRLSQLAGEGFDGTAGAARELVLPLALRLEATVLQAVAPRLDRLADGVEVGRVALQLARPRHHLGRDADEGAEGGAGLDGILPSRPRGGEHPRHRLDVIEG